WFVCRYELLCYSPLWRWLSKVRRFSYSLRWHLLIKTRVRVVGPLRLRWLTIFGETILGEIVGVPGHRVPQFCLNERVAKSYVLYHTVSMPAEFRSLSYRAFPCSITTPPQSCFRCRCTHAPAAPLPLAV